jgi:lycopene cyclase domain-containing protein
MKHYTYFIILIATLFYPLLKSFENKVQFNKKWKYLFPAIIIEAIIFIAGDVWFVNKGIWWFNPQYITGIKIFNLPIEECLFFFIVPYSSIFIYEVLNYYIKKNILQNSSKTTTLFLSISLLILAIIFRDRFYTLITFLSLTTFLLIHQFILKSVYLPRFYLLWAVLIFPFLLFNEIVTGLPITIYNNAQTMQLRILYFPLEDLFYGFLQILLIITLYETFQKTKKIT